MTKRVSLRERRAGDAKGIESIFQGSDLPPEESSTEELPEESTTEESLAEEPVTRESTAEEPMTESKTALGEFSTPDSPTRESALPEPAPPSSQEKPSKTSVSKGSVSKADVPDEKLPLSKVTVYIRPQQVIAVEAIQLAERQRTGQKPDKSELMQEALDLLIEKYRRM